MAKRTDEKKILMAEKIYAERIWEEAKKAPLNQDKIISAMNRMNLVDKKILDSGHRGLLGDYSSHKKNFSYTNKNVIT